MTALRVWAPRANRVRGVITGGHQPPTVHALTRSDDDWWSWEFGDVDPEADYGFLLDDDPAVRPDPRSRRQPKGVHGWSRRYDPHGYEWQDQHWTGRDLPGAVIYELHVGTFTPGGTFASAVERLDHLVDLGITHVELLPVNAVNGTHNWGYDGVAWYAVHEPYGGPDGLKALVDACHQRGLAVILDVVYNHFGPSGNYLPLFGPYLKSGRNTWGDLVNLDGEGSHEVRQYILDNASMWLDEFHMDGLRLDAVHALEDTSEPHILAELAADVDALCAHQSRPLILIAESDLNDPIMIESRTSGGRGIDAQWDDDVHHQLHALLTGERQGYYADFGTLPGVAKTFTSGFFHDGTFSEFRGRVHGAPVDRVTTPGYRFVVFLQDHDQVGNRAQGDRLAQLVSPGLARIGALLLLTGPYTPMLWMGEEWGAQTPWQFFTSHPEKDLGEIVAHGRKAEFASHGWSEDDVPDPQDPVTFERSHLDWSEPDEPEHASMLRLYQTLISLRHRLPELTDPRLDRVAVDYDEDARWVIVHRGGLRVVANLSDADQTVPLDRPAVDVVAATDRGFRIGPDGVHLPAESGAIVRVV